MPVAVGAVPATLPSLLYPLPFSCLAVAAATCIYRHKTAMLHLHAGYAAAAARAHCFALLLWVAPLRVEWSLVGYLYNRATCLLSSLVLVFACRSLPVSTCSCRHTFSPCFLQRCAHAVLYSPPGLPYLPCHFSSSSMPALHTPYTSRASACLDSCMPRAAAAPRFAAPYITPYLCRLYLSCCTFC